jgi:predicted HD phosphohydrolase
VSADWLLALAALLTAVGGLIATIAATRHAHKEGKQEADDDCYRLLREAQTEAEGLAAELHVMRMRALGE